MKELRISMDQSSEKKVLKTKKKGYVGLTDINELQYKQLKNLWDILQKGNKFDKNKNENKI